MTDFYRESRRHAVSPVLGRRGSRVTGSCYLSSSLPRTMHRNSSSFCRRSDVAMIQRYERNAEKNDDSQFLIRSQRFQRWFIKMFLYMKLFVSLYFRDVMYLAPSIFKSSFYPFHSQFSLHLFSIYFLSRDESRVTTEKRTGIGIDRGPQSRRMGWSRTSIIIRLQLKEIRDRIVSRHTPSSPWSRMIGNRGGDE